MFPLLSVHLLFLGGLLQAGLPVCLAKEYYVIPTQPSNFTCPTGKSCHTLDDYTTNSSWLFKGEEEISLLFGSGIHYLAGKALGIHSIVNLTLIGLNSSSIQDSPHIICHVCTFQFYNITTLKMEYLNVANEGNSITVGLMDIKNFIQNHILTRNWFYSIALYELRNSVHFKLDFRMTSISGFGSLLIQNSVFTSSSIFSISTVQEGLLFIILRNISYYGNSGPPDIPSNLFQSLHNFTIDNCHFESNKGSPSVLLISNSTVYIKGKTTFANNIGVKGGAINLVSSNLHLQNDSNVTFINNVGVQGGAMNLLSSYLHFENDSNIMFINNSVIDVGGAIYNDGGLCGKVIPGHKCFYQVPEYLTGANTTVYFINNTAKNGGNDVYGASFKSWCLVNDNIHSCELQDEVFHFSDKPGHDLSQVAAKPERVCLCDEKGQPQCASYSYIVQHRTLTAGEKFNLSLAVVGGDFGTVPGVVYATVNDPLNHFSNSEKITVQYISSPVCTSLEYAISSSGNNLSLFIGIYSSPMIDWEYLNDSIDDYHRSHFIDDDCLRVTPLQINIDIQACPLGLSVNNFSQTCECNTTLTYSGIDHCVVNNSKGLVYRNETTWIGLYKTNDFTEMLFSHDCPHDYCKTDNIPVDLNHADFQCELGHVGILCGRCPSNLSLALGSSQCLNCTNDGGLALLIGFVAAGPALVFLIKILDLTVTVGTTNGLILYANIIWINKNILVLSNGVPTKSFSQNYPSHKGVENSSTELVGDRFASALTFFKVFIAWLNLDFGLESCFFQGMNAYWKTWLQFLFPIYLWIIVLTIIVVCRYSSKITRVFGNNIVGVLYSNLVSHVLYQITPYNCDCTWVCSFI